jgi:multiple antibiotic resistance protein
MDTLSLFSLTVILFLIMDPIGNIAPYLTLVQGIRPSRRTLVLLREMFFAYVLMLIFNYLGEFIFDLLDISKTTVTLASGVILFLIALKILFPSENSLRANLPRGEPFLTPLAVPLIAGPTLLATIMLYADLEPSHTTMLIAITLSSLATLGILFVAPYLHRFLKDSGLMALEKLMGMILVLLGVQRMAEGIKLFIANV